MITHDEYSGICVLSIDGDFTDDECPMLRKVVTDIIDTRHIVSFVVDMQKVPYVDSQGLETLVWLKARSEELFGLFKLAGVDENCRKILEITRLDRRFEIEPDLTSAVKAMR